MDNPELANSTYGVLTNCPLAELDYFSTVDNFVPGIMHDFLEGVVPILIRLLLKNYHGKKIFEVKTLNENLVNFSYGSNDKSSKPTQIPVRCVTDNSSLPGKASEKWCLFKIFPLLVSDYIPENDPHWDLYLICRSISDLLFAPTLKSEDVD